MTTVSPLGELTPAGPMSELPSDLMGACKALEAEFSQILFSTMRKAMVPSEDKGSTAFGMETTKSMLDAQWARLASEGGSLGLAQALYSQLSPETVKSPSVLDEK